MSDKVVDGADRRKQRLMELLGFIEVGDGATSEQIQAFMTVKYGLKWKTTAQYIKELHLSRLIARTSELRKWRTTGNYKKLTKYLYG